MKAVIFDFDGTLFDSMWVWENIDVEFLSRFNKTPTKSIRQAIKNMSVWQSAELFKNEYNLPLSIEEIMDTFAQIANDKYKTQIEPKQGVIEFLHALNKKNIPMCIATASCEKNIAIALERFDILKYFKFIANYNDVKAGKESPDIYLFCAEKLNYNPNEIFVFEDVYHAAKTAKDAGFKVVGVYDKWAHHETDNIKKICNHYIENFKQAGELI